MERLCIKRIYTEKVKIGGNRVLYLVDMKGKVNVIVLSPKYPWEDGDLLNVLMSEYEKKLNEQRDNIDSENNLMILDSLEEKIKSLICLYKFNYMI